MSSDPTTRLTKLLAATNIDDDEEVYKVATEAVRINKTDATAHRTRVVALLKLDRWQDAIRAVDEVGTQMQIDFRLEKSYALYKVGELESALQLLEPLVSASDPQRSARHLAAQVAYKNERFGIAADFYEALITHPSRLNESEDYDILINSLAVLAQLEWKMSDHQPDLTPSRSVPDAFESTYNKGCRALARGEFQDALDILSNAAALCLTAPDLSDEEKKAEMVNILIQQVYVYICLGKFDQAAETASSIELDDTDVSTAILHHINTLVAQQGLGKSNPYLTHRVISSIPPIPAGDKLFGFQSSKLEYNSHVADLLSKKFRGVSSSISKKLKDEQSPTVSGHINSLSAIKSAAECEMESGKPALKKLLNLHESRPEDIGLLLTIVQTYTRIGNPNAASQLIEAFGRRMEEKEGGSGNKYRYLPGMVALKVALLQQQGRQSAILSELCKAAEYWIEELDRNGSDNNSSGKSLLREAGIKLIHSSDPKDLAIAGSAFELLARDSSSDKIARAGFVASMATTDYAKAEPYVSGLESADRLASAVDINALLEGGVVTFPAQLEKQRKKRAADDDNDSRLPQKQANKRIRLRKLPKDYVEGRMMDPERWLPLRDRSYYKPRGKKGKKKAMEATQGGLVKEEQGEVLELVGGAGAVKVEKASSGGNKKKKGKK